MRRSSSALACERTTPSDGQSFGHGAPVLGPDGEQWFYVHHHLDQAPCANAGQCARDVWLSPIDFIDVGDGLGDVHIAPRRPAEDPSYSVPLPAEIRHRSKRATPTATRGRIGVSVSFGG